MSGIPTSRALLEGSALECVALDISKKTPFEGITSVTPLMDSVVTSQDVSVPERARMIFSLDEASQLHARSYIERFLSLRSDQTSERRSLWVTARAYWATVLESYSDILSGLVEDGEASRDALLVAQVVVRTIRAAVLRAKWDAFDGSGMDVAWPFLNKAYAFAIRRGVDRLEVRPRNDRATETTAEREYLRAVALHSLGIESFDPKRVEAATSLVHYVLPQLELSEVQGPGSCYAVDVADVLPPARLVIAPDQLAIPRFFSGAAASLSLRSLLDLSAAGDLSVGMPKQMENPVVTTNVLSRMIRVWANDQPLRRHRRMGMDGQVVVAEGMPSVIGKLSGGEGASGIWKIRDASLQGMGLRLSVPEAARLRVGSLVGFRPADGDHWCIGVVRRLKRLGWAEALPQEQVDVGLELLGRSPEVVSADDGAKACLVLLMDPVQKGGLVRLVLPNPGPLLDQPLYLVGSARAVKLMPRDTLEYGTDFIIRNYESAS